MRHRLHGKVLSRDTKARKALFRSLAISLITKGKIKTSEAKAKAIKGFIDRIINKAKAGSLHSRRQIISMLADKDATAKVIDSIAPAFVDRPSGFTRIIRLGARKSDTASIVVMEFVEGKPIPKKTKKADYTKTKKIKGKKKKVKTAQDTKKQRQTKAKKNKKND